MADPNLFVDPQQDIYVPCETGVELRMSLADGDSFNGTAKRISALGQDAPDRVALESDDAPDGFTLYKQSHDQPAASVFSSQLRLGFSFPPGGQKVPVVIRRSTTNGVTVVTADPAPRPATA